MTDPLIVVEGTLRLPSLRPLADPSLHYGQEWSNARSRATHKLSEVSLLAAHMRTAYVEAITLSGIGSSYRAASIWAAMPDGPTRLSIMRLLDEVKNGVATESHAMQEAEPIQLAVSEPVENHAASESRVPAFLKTAIAIACAAFISWLIVGYESHQSSSKEAAASATKQDEIAAPHDEAPVAQPSAPASAAVVVVAQQAAFDARASEVSAAHVTTAASSVAVNQVSDATKPIATTPATPATPAPKAKRAEPREKKRVKASYAGKPIKVSAVPKKSGGASVVHSPRAPQTQYQTNADDYQVLAKPHRTRATVSRTQSNPINAAPSASKPNPSTDTMALYNMLQHSATLDSNVGTSDASAK